MSISIIHDYLVVPVGLHQISLIVSPLADIILKLNQLGHIGLVDLRLHLIHKELGLVNSRPIKLKLV